MNLITREAAIEIMKSSSNMTLWNANRRMLKKQIGTEDIAAIDSSGLIKKVLGDDQPKTKWVKPEVPEAPISEVDSDKIERARQVLDTIDDTSED